MSGLEAEAYCRIQFSFQIATYGTITIHEADCSLHTQISVLKKDLEGLFGRVETQNWSYRGAPLHDGRTLSQEGIHCRDRRTVRIFVKQDSSVQYN